MLKLLPNCECCDRDLPNGSPDARICSFECTFCAECAQERFGGICPNCGGDLVLRPTRPAAKLAGSPPSSERFTKHHPECAEPVAV
ncbi:MAG: DUF1272 domain-containing protein [Solirubrobacteraceae bacterium]|jgi:hypothetical protein